MTRETIPFEASSSFKEQAAQKRLLTDAFATGHEGSIAAALGLVAKARGMTQIARQANVSRGSLYKDLSLEPPN
jgi:probable addiction module antidote protein